jgi:serine/threonine protein kinase
MCAMKFTILKGEEERQIILNEVGLMMVGKENEGILCIFDCFEFKNRLWIFMELMDGGALTPMLEQLAGNYSENFIKYVSYKTIKALKFLHDRHILHRDIKSDNILYSESGEIKLADFGYAT